MSVFPPPGHTGRIPPVRWLAWLLAFALLACDHSQSPIPPSRRTEPKGPSLFLEVQSTKGGAVPAAQVRMSSGQRQEASAEGTVLLQEIPPGPQFVYVAAENFFPTLTGFDLAAGMNAGARLKLFPLGEPVKVFDASTGTTIGPKDVGLDVDIDIPPGAFFDENNARIEGEVEAFLSVLDLEGKELRVAPGILEGVTGSDGTRVPLESFGMVSLVFRNKGEVTHQARGVGVRVRIPGSVRAGSAKTGMKIPAWQAQSGGATWSLTGDEGEIVEWPGTAELAWEVEVANMPPVLNMALPYWWRSELADRDNPLEPTSPAWVETACLEVLVQDDARQPVTGLMVEALGTDYFGVSRALTDGSGRVRLLVMREQALELVIGSGAPETVRVSGAGTCTPGEGEPPTVLTRTVPARTCTAGAERDCASGLTQGICRPAYQVCDVDGLEWGACGGEVGPMAEVCGNTLDDNCDGSVNEACTRLCDEGATESCYTGPDGTQGTGECKAGVKTCVAGGTAWSACEGQRLPEDEDYAWPGDEDCNGVASLCWPGKQEACAYTGRPGTEGVGPCHAGTRTCNAQGTAWAPCTGEVVPLPEELCTTPLEDDDCDGEVNESTVCICTPGSRRGCYTGPQGTQGVGVCLAGEQSCNAAGTDWDACLGEVTPRAESCANAADDDCNGQPNDAPECVCLPGTSESCYSGPPQTRDVGECSSGSRTCEASGEAWGACQGEVLPLPEELCTTPGDDDCDGVANEVAVCICAPQSEQDCYSGPGGTQGVGVCRSGRQTCSASGTGWGACVGEVTPAPAELCGTALDDDCDGQVNENPPCVWGDGSPLASPRQQHAAVWLRNGKVLVAGGVDAVGTLATVELYDPASGTWTAGSPLGAGRRRPAATLLEDGRVLVVGGADAAVAPLGTSEVYDPSTNTWGATAMTATRYEHTLTRLANGKVLAVGGLGTGDGTAEIYDPVAGSWAPAPNNPGAPRWEHAAVLLGNGKVLVAGGTIGSAELATAEVYDPDTGTWSATGAMQVARGKPTATLLGNGKVLVAGGYNSQGRLATAEVYDPVTNAWTPLGSTMSTPRSRHTATLLGNGKVLVQGGLDSGGNPVATAEVHDPASGTWALLDTLSAARAWHTATLLGSGQVLIVGGSGTGGTPLASSELYTPLQPLTDTWTAGMPMSAGRIFHTATVLADGRVLVVGGQRSAATPALNSAELFDPATGVWSATGALASARGSHTATLLEDGRVLVAGGSDGTGPVLASAELYNPATGTWSAALPMPSQVEHHTATRLANGRVLIAGGSTAGEVPVTAACEYDPVAGTWLSVGSMTTARKWFTATLLNTGDVLVTGGNNGSPLDTAELYDPVTRQWAQTAGTMPHTRDAHTATLLDDGRVLVVGGFGDTGFRDQAALYDPATGTWASTGTLSVARREHEATRLANGKVLITGGKLIHFNSMPFTELYDPATGTWSVAPPMREFLDRHTSTLLNDGRVLVTGGSTRDNPLSTVQLYTP
jgi:hypothetical protein